MIHQPLPRLANVIALRSTDPGKRRRFIAKLQARGMHRVFTPAPLWVVGVRDLPGSAEPVARDEAEGCFLMEGQGCLPREEGARAQARAALHKSCDRAATSSESADDVSFLSVRPDGSAVFQRSLGGRVPCYFWQRDDDLVLSTDSADLIRIADHDGRPDPLITALCLSGYTNDVDGRAHLLGSKKLNKAQGLVVDADGRLRVYEHWQPLAFEALKWPTSAQRKERIARFRSELLKVLDEGLSTTGLNLLSLSGGVDSSLLLAIAVGMLKRPVASVSLIPAPDDAVYARETERIAWLRGLYPTEPHLSFEMSSETQFELWGKLRPAAIPLFNPTIAGLTVLADAPHPRVSFGGEFADEVCGSHNFTAGDWLLHAPHHAWTFSPRDLPMAIKRVDLLSRDPLQDRLARWKQPLAVQLESWMHRDIHREWRIERAAVDGRFRASLSHLANPCLWAHHREIDWQAMQWEWCSALGIHRLNPFSASRFVALALCSHPAERVGRQDKRLSRLAFEHDFRAELLGRRDKGGHEKPRQTGVTAAAWKKCLGALNDGWATLVDSAWTTEHGMNSRLDESERMSNLTKLGDLPQRLVYFSESVHKIREGHV